jgi:glycosyltransferase involved in cell wall biosynthesis
VGRAAPIKGITVFLDALAILRRRGVCCKARVFGRFNPKDGLGAVLLRRVRALRLEGCIELIGNQTDENVAKELAAATVFVHPSFVDNSPNSICEAMLVGTPVVANSCGGMPSLIRHDETGILVSSGDPEVLAEEIVRLLENPVKARELAERGRQEALIRHDPGRVALRQANIYSEILQNFQNKGTEG